MNIEKARDLINSRDWYHTFEILPGIWTPGKNHRLDVRSVLSDAHGLPEDLSGKTALDIGTLDGPYAFELEKRGARVTAIDIIDADRSRFNLGKSVLGSSARFVLGNVNDLPALFPDQKFDVVTFFGVWYHLKNPEFAFEQINRVCSDNALLLGEGECILNYIEPDSAKTFPDARTLSNSPLPLSLFYSNGVKGDISTWSVPNPACVRSWLDASGFDLIKEGFEDNHPHQRMRVTAKKSNRKIRFDNPV